MRLVQLVDANDVNPDGIASTSRAPFDKPYDWAVSGNPTRRAPSGTSPTTAGLREIATYADGIGPWKPYIVSTAVHRRRRRLRDVNGDGAVDERDRVLLPPTDVVDARARGRPARAPVHLPQRAVPPGRRLRRQSRAEYWQFYELGVDGVFSDFPDTAVRARCAFVWHCRH